MNPPSWATLAIGVVLIGFGLVYPLAALWRLNQALSHGQPYWPLVIADLVLAGLLPLTAVLAGFFLLSTAARGSLIFLGALIGSALFLVITLLARWWLQRRVSGLDA